MKIQILDKALGDLIHGFQSHEAREPDLGGYFLDCLFADIDSLLIYAGIHRLVFTYHRCLSKRFPFAIYYSLDGENVRVHAVLDCRRNPSWTRTRLEEER